MQIKYDKKTGRFRDSRGRFVSEQTVRKAVSNIGEAFKSESNRFTEDLTKGRITRREWTLRMASLIKANLVTTSAIGKGGRKQMNQSDWGKVGAKVKAEYGYLRGFVSGMDKLSDAQIFARARSYASAGFIAFSQFLADVRGPQFREAKRNLHASESCSGCRSVSGYWMPIADLPPIGSMQCRSNCRCSISYR